VEAAVYAVGEREIGVSAYSQEQGDDRLAVVFFDGDSGHSEHVLRLRARRNRGSRCCPIGGFAAEGGGWDREGGASSYPSHSWATSQTPRLRDDLVVASISTLRLHVGERDPRRLIESLDGVYVSSTMEVQPNRVGSSPSGSAR